jgi:hypothetical protein
MVHERVIVFLLPINSDPFHSFWNYQRTKKKTKKKPSGSLTIPNSSSNCTVSLLVLQAGAVHPLGLFPVTSDRTLILFSNTSFCWLRLKVLTNSCVYPCKPTSCPFSTIFLICAGNDSAECAGVNHVALISYLSQSLSRRSMPTVAPKTPRDMSVGFAGLPSRVFILLTSSVRQLKN